MASQRILVVEDNEDVRGLFRLALALDGFDVLEARTGYEAIRLYDSYHPDLVVLDLWLPGIDGFSVHQEIVAHGGGRRTPIVIVTSSRQDLSSLEASCILRKPVEPDELVRTVRRCLVMGNPTAGA
jgi:DNA-binding response OmpR family regulator